MNSSKLIKTAGFGLIATSIGLAIFSQPWSSMDNVKAVDSAAVDLQPETFVLVNADGQPTSIFEPNEPIYIQTTISNAGSEPSVTGIKTQIYAHQPEQARIGMVDTPEFSITHDAIGPTPNGQPHVYQSTPNHWSLQHFSTPTHSFSQSQIGTYTARLYVDAMGTETRDNPNDNQLTVNYTIANDELVAEASTLAAVEEGGEAAGAAAADSTDAIVEAIIRIITEILANQKPLPNPTPTPAPTPWPSNTSWPQPVQNPSSIQAIVNKKFKLPSSYTPANLRTVNIPLVNNQPLRNEAATALEQMNRDMLNQGIRMHLRSGYRSYATQDSLYWSYVNQHGQAAADTFSARPGHSEHQTGLAVDVGDRDVPGCDLAACFANTAAGRFVAANGHKYGFIIRYPNGKDGITGYKYEPWHLRYLGVSTATAVYNSGKTLEEYFNVPGGGY